MSQEFITNFHNLNGVTIGERRKNLFLLLKAYKKDGGDLNFAHLQPRTFLEEKFRVDVLIYFKRVEELIEVLKNEKTFLLGRIFKERWFLEALCKVSAKDLITDVFPNVSFRVKVKIVNKLALRLNDANRATDYFEAIKDKYGFYLAAKLLPSCYPDFILDFLATHNFKPTWKQALLIIKRYPELTKEIFSMLMDKYRDEDNYLLIRHIANCDPELFLELNEKFKLRMRLGWRLTEKFVNAHRDDVIRKPQTYFLVLHKRTIVKTLNNNFRSLFVGLLPKTLEEFKNVEDYLLSIMKLVPRRQKPIELWLEVFQHTYGCLFWNYPIFLSLEFVEMLPLAVRHQQLSIENRPAFVNEEVWVPYLPTDKSLRFLKQKLELSSAVKTREQLVNCLVLTCKLNSNTDALLDVCGYMLSKHRNDKASVHRSFLSGLLSHFELEKLSPKHWALINEFANLSTENDHETHAIREAYVHYLLLNNLPVKDLLKEWIRPFSDLLIIPKNPHFTRLCLVTFGEIVNELEDLYDSWAPYFIRQVITWNESHLGDNISVFQYARFEEWFSRKCSENKLDALDIQILVYRIKHSQSKRKEYFDIYLSIEYLYGNYEILNWLLQHDLQLVAAYIGAITSMILQNFTYTRLAAFLRQTRNLSHLEIPQKVVALCTVKLRESKDRNSALALSLLQDSPQFVDLVREYYPTEREADYKTPEGRELYALLQVIGGCLKHLNPPSAALESILIFCKGDYLKLVRGSLYSIVDSVSENKLVPFFAELITRAVSTRKHALHLTFRVLDKSEVHRIITRFMNKEKNASLRKVIFKICFNFFVMNPEEFTWELVTLNLKEVDLEDQEAIEILLQIDKVPREYIVAYILLAWEALHNRPDPDNRWEASKGSVLRSVSPQLISKMPNEFFENVISLYFLKCDTLTHFSSTVNTFVCKYILHCDNQIEQMRRLTSCFGIVSKYVTSSWNDPSRRTSARNTTIDFLKEFCAPFLSGDYYNKEIFQAFATMWNTVLEPQQTLDEYIHLKLTYITLELDSSLAAKLEALCDELVSTYGQIIIGLLCKKINFFSRYFFKVNCKSERYSLIDSLIHNGSSIACLILAIFLLDDTNPKKIDIKEKYDIIIQKLEKCQEPVIQLYLSSHMGGNINLYYT